MASRQLTKPMTKTMGRRVQSARSVSEDRYSDRTDRSYEERERRESRQERRRVDSERERSSRDSRSSPHHHHHHHHGEGLTPTRVSSAKQSKSRSEKKKKKKKKKKTRDTDQNAPVTYGGFPADYAAQTLADMEKGASTDGESYRHFYRADGDQSRARPAGMNLKKSMSAANVISGSSTYRAYSAVTTHNASTIFRPTREIHHLPGYSGHLPGKNDFDDVGKSYGRFSRETAGYMAGR